MSPCVAWWADFTAVDMPSLLGSVSRCIFFFFCLLPANRDLIRKLLVVDRTRRLGNMKVSVCLRTYHPLDPLVARHRTFLFLEIKGMAVLCNR